MKLQRKASTIFDKTLDLLALFAAVLLVFAMLIVCADIVVRYFTTSLLWVIETAEYILLYITFLGAAWLLKRGKHVTMDLVLNQLNSRPKAVLNIITSIVGAIICLVIAWYGVEVTWDHFQTGYFLGTYLEPPSFAIIAIIPIGSFLLFIQFSRRAHRYMGDWQASLTTEREQ